MMQAAIERLYQRAAGAVRTGLVRATRADGPVQLLQIEVSGLETKDNVINPGWWGIISRPHPGAQVAVLVPGGNSPGGIVVASGDQRYKFALEEGEVALFDDLGQSIHLTRNGIVINGGGKTVTVKNAPKTRIEGDLMVTGEIAARADSSPIRLSTHKHGGVQTGPGITAPPVPGS